MAVRCTYASSAGIPQAVATASQLLLNSHSSNSTHTARTTYIFNAGWTEAKNLKMKHMHITLYIPIWTVNTWMATDMELYHLFWWEKTKNSICILLPLIVGHLRITNYLQIILHIRWKYIYLFDVSHTAIHSSCPTWKKCLLCYHRVKIQTKTKDKLKMNFIFHFLSGQQPTIRNWT